MIQTPTKHALLPSCHLGSASVSCSAPDCAYREAVHAPSRDISCFELAISVACYSNSSCYKLLDVAAARLLSSGGNAYACSRSTW